METDTPASSTKGPFPVLYMPKSKTPLELNCDMYTNVFIDLKITSLDNNSCIYSGFCNIKLIDIIDVNINLDKLDQEPKSASSDGNHDLVAMSDSGSSSYPSDNQCQVWIDTARSPYVYNSCNTAESQETYSVYESQNLITVEHDSEITQNVFDCTEEIIITSTEELEHKKLKYQSEMSNQNNLSKQNFQDDNEIECSIFLPKLPEEISHEKDVRDREVKYAGLESENDALKQLMSPEIQSLSKQHKTILFLGDNSRFGHTIQIAMNDLKCASVKQKAEGEEDFGETTLQSPSNHKKYQCGRCKQIFNRIPEFKQHIVGDDKSVTDPQKRPDLVMASTAEMKFVCPECGKTLKSKEKFDKHYLGHGDPDVECDKCHKVFATKFTLRTHRKLHLRKQKSKAKPITNMADTYKPSKLLKKSHKKSTEADRAVADLIASLEDDLNDIKADNVEIERDNNVEQDIIGPEKQDEISRADSIIAKVIANDMFLLHPKKYKCSKKYRTTCTVCHKIFDRLGDLKRHLIEHVIRSTLAKNPVNENGTLNIVCEICKTAAFTKIDKFKAHLREHAKITLYKCNLCDKSFSDSSNFSKHKKIHETTCFQCDRCHRKFKSKKMIAQHIEYHNKNSPIQCFYCDKVFHFESMLNKHITNVHTREKGLKFRCRFCHMYCKNLKEKWDHEWSVHNVRRLVIDCLLCGAKFRKYSELKRHCTSIHDVVIPAKKKLKY